jgi:DNA-binding NtrC family response regulator
MDHSSESVIARQVLQMASSIEGTAAASLPLVTASALVVERTVSDAVSIAAVLTACRFHVTVAESFLKAKTHLSAHPPTVLLTEIRLAEYNGLHLVLRAKSVRPDIAALVMSSIADPVLQADAEAMGATFVLKPVSEQELTAAVFRTIFQATTGSTAPIRAPFERRQSDRRAAVVPMPADRRNLERRRDLPSLLRLVAPAG